MIIDKYSYYEELTQNANYILTSQPKTLVENDTELREIMRMRNLSTVAIENLQEKSQQKRLWQSLLEWSWRPTFYLNKKRARVNSSKSYFFLNTSQ